MHLNFTGCFFNATYTTDDGIALYKVESDSSLRPGIQNTTISRAVPSFSDGPERDNFEKIAMIQWKQRSTDPAMIHFEGKQPMKMVDFLKKDGRGWNGHHRTFAGPDGQQYHWELGRFRPTLTRIDEAKTPVALFHRSRTGIFGDKRHAALEIMEDGEAIMDLIVSSFVFVEKIRKDHE